MDEIRSVNCPNCIICGGGGNLLYDNLVDRLFGAGGLWSLRQCSNEDCGLIWPDPKPLTEEIGKAYANYYTHSHSVTEAKRTSLRSFYRQLKWHVLTRKYGYPEIPGPRPSFATNALVMWAPGVSNSALADVRYLPFVQNGALLDVGCGSGEWLQQMAKFGWSVQGVDFDSKAVSFARKIGLNVRCGSLEDQHYPSASFDAVTLSHVIEHVPDPIATITECFRLLKPGGRLVLFTPNSSSLCHRFYKKDWRGLEPPRHLQIFSFKSMRLMFSRFGFREVVLRPDIGTSVTFESHLLRSARLKKINYVNSGWRSRPFWRLFSVFQHLVVRWIPTIAECQLVVATKKDSG